MPDMLIIQFKRYIAFLILLSGLTFSQNPQFLSNGVFFTDNYFFDVNLISKLDSFNYKAINYGQNDSTVFIGNTKNIFSYNKFTLKQNPEFDTALFYNLSITSTRLNWDIVYLNGKKFSLDNKNHIITIFDKDGFYLSEIQDKETPYERNTSGRDMLVKGNNCIIHVKDLDGETGYIFSCYDEFGNEAWKEQTGHTEIEIKGDTHYLKRYLNYFEHNTKYIIFTTNVFYSEFRKTIILDISSGKLTELPITVSGVLFDKQDNIIGLLSYNEKENEISFFDKMSDKVLWKYSYTDRAVNPSKITALLHDDILILALYHQISTGSDLLAMDLKTGNLKWHAQVDQVNAEHSRYYNRVNLFRYKDKILMEGIESYGKYLQVFNVTTGAKLFSEINTKY